MYGSESPNQVKLYNCLTMSKADFTSGAQATLHITRFWLYLQDVRSMCAVTIIIRSNQHVITDYTAGLLTVVKAHFVIATKLHLILRLELISSYLLFLTSSAFTSTKDMVQHRGYS